MRYCIWSSMSDDEEEASWYVDGEDLGDAAITALSQLGYSIVEADLDEEEIEDPPYGFGQDETDE
jgi:hypothetical protein